MQRNRSLNQIIVYTEQEESDDRLEKPNQILQNRKQIGAKEPHSSEKETKKEENLIEDKHKTHLRVKRLELEGVIPKDIAGINPLTRSSKRYLVSNFCTERCENPTNPDQGRLKSKKTERKTSKTQNQRKNRDGQMGPRFLLSDRLAAIKFSKIKLNDDQGLQWSESFENDFYEKISTDSNPGVAIKKALDQVLMQEKTKGLTFMKDIIPPNSK